MIENKQEPELGDYTREEFLQRERVREEHKLQETANEIEKRASDSALKAIKWVKNLLAK